MRDSLTKTWTTPSHRTSCASDRRVAICVRCITVEDFNFTVLTLSIRSKQMGNAPSTDFRPNKRYRTAHREPPFVLATFGSPEEDDDRLMPWIHEFMVDIGDGVIVL